MDIKDVTEGFWNHQKLSRSGFPRRVGPSTFLSYGSFESSIIAFMKIGRAMQLALCPLEQEGRVFLRARCCPILQSQSASASLGWRDTSGSYVVRS